MTLLELINRIQLEATQVSQQPIQSAFLDTSVLTEILLPRVFSFVTNNVVKDENQLSALRKNHTLTFTAGAAPLPESFKEAFAESTYVIDADTGSFSNASYKKQFFDYVTGTNNIVALFTFQNRQMLYRNGSQPAGVFAGALGINAVFVPQLPTLVSDQVDLTNEILQQVIGITASVITGAIPLSMFSLDYGMLEAKAKK